MWLSYETCIFIYRVSKIAAVCISGIVLAINIYFVISSSSDLVENNTWGWLIFIGIYSVIYIVMCIYLIIHMVVSMDGSERLTRNSVSNSIFFNYYCL